MPPVLTKDAAPRAADRQVIRATLERVRRRVFFQHLLASLVFDLTFALGIFALVLVLERLFLPGVLTPIHFALVLGATVLLSAGRTIAFGRLTDFDAAVLVDGRLALKERVASALFLEDAGAQSKEAVWLTSLLEREAAGHLATSRIEEHLRLRLPRRAYLVVVLLLCNAGLGYWLPHFDVLGASEERVASSRLEEEVKRAKDELARRLQELKEEAEKQDADKTKKLLEELLRAELARERPADQPPPGENAPKNPSSADPRKEAMIEVARREDKLREGMRDADFEKLRRALKDMQTLSLRDVKLTRKLQQALKSGELDKAKDELKALQEDLEKLAKKSQEELTEEEKKKLEQLSAELARLSRMDSLGALSQQLSQSADMLSGGDLGSALEGLELSQEELAQLARMQNDLNMLKDALDLAQMTREELARLGEQLAQMGGEPHNCPNCGKKLAQGASQQPGGT